MTEHEDDNICPVHDGLWWKCGCPVATAFFGEKTVKNIMHEPTNHVCEKGHKIRRYQVVGEFCHRLLCPTCDADIIENMRDGKDS